MQLTEENKNIMWNNFDELALLLGMERKKDETNIKLRNRIVNRVDGDSTKEGISDWIRTAVNLVDIYEEDVPTKVTGRQVFYSQNTPLSEIVYNRLNNPDLDYAFPVIIDNSSEEVYDDWHLPAIDELTAIYNAWDSDSINFPGYSADDWQDFADEFYWTSTEYDTDDAGLRDFSSGAVAYLRKGGDYYVRAVRRSQSIPTGCAYIPFSGEYLWIYPEDSGQYEWGVVGEDVPGAESTTNGEQNTADIVAAYPSGNYAVNVCVDLEIIEEVVFTYNSTESNEFFSKDYFTSSGDKEWIIYKSVDETYTNIFLASYYPTNIEFRYQTLIDDEVYNVIEAPELPGE